MGLGEPRMRELGRHLNERVKRVNRVVAVVCVMNDVLIQIIEGDFGEV